MAGAPACGLTVSWLRRLRRFGSPSLSLSFLVGSSSFFGRPSWSMMRRSMTEAGGAERFARLLMRPGELGKCGSTGRQGIAG